MLSKVREKTLPHPSLLQQVELCWPSHSHDYHPGFFLLSNPPAVTKLQYPLINVEKLLIYHAN